MSSKLIGSILALLAAACCGWMLEPAMAQDPPTRAISPIAGDLYRFQNNNHFSVFLVTDDGVMVTDPISADAAAWLEAEIEKRFAKPVRYLIYSHDHADHIAGGEVFADTATVIAHDNAKKHIVEENRPTAVPDLTFSDSLTVTLGGKTVELSYLGRNHGDNLIVMYFPAERALFAVDIVAVNRLAFQDFPNAYIEDWIESLKAVEAIDFDILVPGHGALGTKADLVAHRRYIEELRAEVLNLMRQNKTLDEIKAQVTMPAYKEWGRYDEWLSMNIDGMYRHLSLYRRGN